MSIHAGSRLNIGKRGETGEKSQGQGKGRGTIEASGGEQVEAERWGKGSRESGVEIERSVRVNEGQ